MLSLMAKEFFAQSPVMIFPLVALFLFLAVFTVLSIRAFLRPKEAIEMMAKMPLEGDGEAST